MELTRKLIFVMYLLLLGGNRCNVDKKWIVSSKFSRLFPLEKFASLKHIIMLIVTL